MKKLDLTGQRFGRLTVINEAGKAKDGRIRWQCLCDCGQITETPSTKTLRNGTCKSCGCIQKENPPAKTHGQSDTNLFHVWNGIKQRCLNPRSQAFNNYGGRGIKVCDEWREDFQAFHDWAIKNGYRLGREIDRIDNDGDYEPGNCRWVTSQTNNNNRRSNTLVEIGGKTHTISEWSRITGIPRSTLQKRISSGKTPDEILKR
jgi:hypothetical protein